MAQVQQHGNILSLQDKKAPWSERIYSNKDFDGNRVLNETFDKMASRLARNPKIIGQLTFVTSSTKGETQIGDNEFRAVSIKKNPKTEEEYTECYKISKMESNIKGKFMYKIQPLYCLNSKGDKIPSPVPLSTITDPSLPDALARAFPSQVERFKGGFDISDRFKAISGIQQ